MQEVRRQMIDGAGKLVEQYDGQLTAEQVQALKAVLAAFGEQQDEDPESNTDLPDSAGDSPNLTATDGDPATAYRGPRNAEQMHRALKARNPAYRGNATLVFEDGRLVTADITGSKIRDVSPLKGITSLKDLRCDTEHKRAALGALHRAWKSGKIGAVKAACEDIVSGWKTVETMNRPDEVVNPVGRARWMLDNLLLLRRLGRRVREVPPAASQSGGHSYLVFGYGQTWTDARKIARALGGHLAVITDREEDQFVRGLLRDAGFRRAYIGLGEGNRWVTGESWKPSDHNRLEGSGGRFGFIDVRANVWSTERQKTTRLPFIIEWEKTPQN
jgi:hypothetical protein